LSEELKNIEARYEKRKNDSVTEKNIYSNFVVNERNSIYKKIILENFSSLDQVKLLEIGAGGGANINFFKSIQIPPNNLYANELLEDRVKELQKDHPDIHILPGDALSIKSEFQFDLVFQSTVFTSILDVEFRKSLANKMWDLTKSGGIILWYDFVFDNPNNKDVKKVSIKEVKSLFPEGKIIYSKRLTLAPPLGRRVGKLYPLFNYFPFLRSHYVAAIQKK
jgi:phospholipid N-methyltransferase